MKIKKSTFAFLEDLKANNNREWFQANRNRYDEAQQNIKDFVQEIVNRLSEFDPQINTEIKVAKCLFRIYRDVRFSKNKDPYKNWFAAGISVDGRKLEGPEYYLHIEPEKSFIAVGYWRPSKNHLDAIRQEIDYNAATLHEALAKGKWSADDLDRDDKLIRPPAGYTADDPNIELLKLKSFILYEKVSQKQLESPKALDTLISFCERALPFKLFIHEAIDQ